jgi:hypothetical protein
LLVGLAADVPGMVQGSKNAMSKTPCPKRHVRESGVGRTVASLHIERGNTMDVDTTCKSSETHSVAWREEHGVDLSPHPAISHE